MELSKLESDTEIDGFNTNNFTESLRSSVMSLSLAVNNIEPIDYDIVFDTSDLFNIGVIIGLCEDPLTEREFSLINQLYGASVIRVANNIIEDEPDHDIRIHITKLVDSFLASMEMIRKQYSSAENYNGDIDPNNEFREAIKRFEHLKAQFKNQVRVSGLNQPAQEEDFVKHFTVFTTSVNRVGIEIFKFLDARQLCELLMLFGVNEIKTIQNSYETLTRIREHFGETEYIFENNEQVSQRILRDGLESLDWLINALESLINK